MKKACDQIVLLNQRIGDVGKRYKKAKNSKNRVFQTRLRRQLKVIESTCCMYHKYAFTKAELVAELRAELFGETVEIVSG